ncbi:hypothetical protein MTR67_001277 [Solanum verrucosum]|uniref:Uncharacterized protein n=1 Tax=Solanum verrucosum TaxID=315347 RepID=A0AAF0PP09_SOLVR|nr:hypothetical protein MTR67_001277 [Solanum verrucosum]
MYIPTWKWEQIIMSFIVRLPTTMSGYDSIWLVVDTLTKFAHFILIHGQSKRMIQVLEDMLQACVINFGSRWDRHFPLGEFAYNNNYRSSIQMAPFQMLYDRQCRSLMGWFDLAEMHSLNTYFLRDALEQVCMI